MIRTALVASILALACHAVAADSPVVAEVGKQAITLLDVENALLKKEGRRAMADWVSKALDRTDFTALHDDDVILTIGFNKITRRQLADALLHRGIAEVREDLIKTAVVEQALAASNIVVTETLLDTLWQRMARLFTRNLKAQGQGEIDFAQWIRNKERMSPEEFRARPEFRLLAGLYALVQARAAAEFSEDELKAWFRDHPERWRTWEAVDLSVIFVPYKKETKDGPVSRAERDRLAQVMDGLHRQISRGEVAFADTWQYFGRPYDPNADQGHAGWTRQDGTRDKDGPRISTEVTQAAWGVTRFPTLLPPLADDRGVTIALVHGHRPQRDPDFAEIRDRVRADRIDETLEQRTDALLDDLRRKADVNLHSLPEAIGK